MNTRRLEIWIWLADMAWILLAFIGADLLRFGPTWSADDRILIRGLVPFLIATCVTWSALSLFMQMDGFRGGWRISAVLSQLLLGICCTLGVIAVLGYFTRSYVSRLALGYFTVLLGAGFLSIRCGARWLLRLRHDQGAIWRVLVLGSGRVAQEVAAKIEQHPEMLCKVVGHLYPTNEGGEVGPTRYGTSQFSTLEIFELFRASRINEIVVALPYPPTAEIRKMISRAHDMGIAASLVPQPYELYAYKPKLISLDGLPLLQLQEPGLHPRYVVLKRALDFVAASVLILPALMLLLPIAAVLVLKKGSAFQPETRIGQYGIPFSMQRLNVPRPVVSGSKFERMLEWLSITELPQLWNVIRGQMSLVGPRPETPGRSSQYSEWEQRRLRVKPGMTGLAQVHGLREYSPSEQKTRFDLQYVINPYFLWDVSLLLQTIWTLLVRLFSRLPNREEYEMDWKTPAPASQGLISNAHSTQPSAD